MKISFDVYMEGDFIIGFDSLEKAKRYVFNLYNNEQEADGLTIAKFIDDNGYASMCLDDWNAHEIFTDNCYEGWHLDE